jgi:nitrate/nitrite transport system permease protein
MRMGPRLKAALLSTLLFAACLLAWHLATLPKAGPRAAVDPEYAKLMGLDKSKPDGLPTLAQMGSTAWKQLSHPFYDAGSNDKGIGIQLAYSLARVGLGFTLAALVAIPLGFVIGLSPLVHRALNPFIQVLKPISPLAWMPLALYTIKDSAASSIFVIFICSVWPMLINTAHGVASVRREWLNVARTLEAGTWRTCVQVILPAAAPVILTGIGYFVWNEWNNLSLSNVIFAILVIGVVGMILDLMFAALQHAVTYTE